ncbi:hypothetical protein SAMN04487926_1546 [Paraburkholderia steynii]|uniref:Uncharacterized protein n=1 Tax=Paraburkholderia steynii TaxID=1245441 RepID=A0A7Z7BKR5_9BURK|nr:hypothetical protein SAMN04487926_1546 [Paraburkholderia steynii]
MLGQMAGGGNLAINVHLRARLKGFARHRVAVHDQPDGSPSLAPLIFSVVLLCRQSLQVNRDVGAQRAVARCALT